MPNRETEISFPGNSRDNPAYAIQDFHGQRKKSIALLLGQFLATATLAREPKGHDSRLHVKVDHPHGGALPQIKGHDRFDFYGHIDDNSSEIVELFGRRLICVATEKISGGDRHLLLRDFQASESTLMVSREDLTALFPQLHGGVADPFFVRKEKRMVLLEERFHEVLDAVRKRVEAGQYLLID